MHSREAVMSAQLPQLPPSAEALEAVFCTKYGDPGTTGWSPRQRFRNGYFLPADIYEATVEQLITPGCRWIDVGGGHNIFPENRGLAATLVARSSWCVAV